MSASITLGDESRPYLIPRITPGYMPHFIPYVNGISYLNRALRSMESHKDRIILVDNRDNFDLYIPDTCYPVEVWKPPVALSHAQLMTWLVLRCRRLNYAWFTWSHHDCEVVDDSLSKLYVYAADMTARDEQWGVLLTRDYTKPEAGPWNHVDVLAAIDIGAMLKIGGWDWVRFPDVFSDYDAYGKLRKAGYLVIQTGFPIIHQDGGSQTVAHDKNRSIVKSEAFGTYARLWELRKKELGLEWPPS